MAKQITSPLRSCFDRYQDPRGAREYRWKYRGSLARLLSNTCEFRAVRGLVAPFARVGTILDIPCGAGRLLPVLSAMCEELTLADSSRAMLVEAAAAAAELPASERPARISTVHASASALPFADRSFDLVVCWRLLHHFPDRDNVARILGEVARVARRGLVISFSDAETRKGRRRLGNPERARASQSFLTLEDVKDIARNEGLRVIATRHLSRIFSAVAGVACERFE